MGEVIQTSWEQIPQDEAFPGIFRQVLHGETTTVTRYTYSPGSSFPAHSHLEEQITIVHTGSIEFEVEGNTVTLSAGDVAIIPARARHGARVPDTNAESVITDNFVPSGAGRTLSFGEPTR
ncbi:MAG: cupin domain-containing protein [Chloroflexota bacterium]